MHQHKHKKYIEMKKQLIGTVILLFTFGLTWYLYDWKLPLLIISFLWGNNLEQRND